MKKVLSSLLVVSILSISVPAFAADNDSTKLPASEKASPLRSAAAQSGSQLVLVRTDAAAVKAQSVPTSLPKSGSGRIRKNGVGMVVGLVSTLAGVAGTVYMMKMMKKQTDEITKQQ
jgi:hypothetical protein